jgi:putative salt-induced outer membrane protein
MNRFALLMLSALLASGAISAQQANTDDGKVWQTSAELGAINTSGNTAGTSITGKIDARQELDSWNNQYIFSAFFKEDEKTDEAGNNVNERSAERYLISAKGAYKLNTEFDNVFMIGSHTNDQFGAFEKYNTVAVGYGTRLYQAKTQHLDVEIGPGYFFGTRATGETENGLIIRGAAAYHWQISESAAFSQTMSVEYGDDNTRSIAETAVTAKINGAMQMKAAFLVQNDSDVQPDKKNTDTQTSLTLVYSF